MSHESDSASRHRNMLKSLRVNIPHVGASMPAIGFVRQPPTGHYALAESCRCSRHAIALRRSGMPTMSQYDRLLAIGCSAVAIGLALAIFGEVAGTRDWFIFEAGIAVIIFASVMVVTALRGKRRTGVTTTGARRVGTRAAIRSYVERARQSPRRRVLAVLGVLWVCYNVIGFVASVVMAKWAYALVYGVLAIALPVLAFVRASTPKSPTT
jgi:hypothetical protein